MNWRWWRRYLVVGKKMRRSSNKKLKAVLLKLILISTAEVARFKSLRRLLTKQVGLFISRERTRTLIAQTSWLPRSIAHRSKFKLIQICQLSKRNRNPKQWIQIPTQLLKTSCFALRSHKTKIQIASSRKLVSSRWALRLLLKLSRRAFRISLAPAAPANSNTHSQSRRHRA